MTLGLSIEAFTTLHVVISLVGIATGVVAVAGMALGRALPGWTAVFLVTTVLTSVTGAAPADLSVRRRRQGTSSAAARRLRRGSSNAAAPWVGGRSSTAVSAGASRAMARAMNR